MLIPRPTHSKSFIIYANYCSLYFSSIVFAILCMIWVKPVSAQIIQTFSSSGTFTVPSNVYQITVEAWGGGGGASSTTFASRPGAGGGAYTSSVLPVIPGQTYTVTVGAGGTTASPTGNAGGNSIFSLGSTNYILAAGGSGGGETTPGSGGTIAASIGTVRYAGGNGGLRFFPMTPAANNGGGGGGGSAFSNANGNNGGNGSTSTGGAGGTGTGSGGNGGGTSPISGQAGLAPGGGGGYVSFNLGAASGAGAAGRVVISYCPEFDVDITGNTAISFGCSTTLTASGGVSYLWSPGGATTESITVSPITNTTYTVVATDVNGCTNSA